MDDRRLVKVSKRMSKVLRHDPGRVGLVLDPAGWAAVDEFLVALRITRTELDEVVARNNKRRFAIERGADGVERIRASQGHSIPVELGLAPLPPPARLYHGTSASLLPSIRATGLDRGGRHHVHLSADVDTARVVGARRGGQIVIIEVDAAAMARDGYAFYRSANGVWLTDTVPTAYLGG